jgi:NitT/TauT family transport system substrate-binding protein
MHGRKLRLLLPFLVALALTLTGCSSGSDTSAKADSIRLVLVPATVSVVPYIAAEHGFFKKNGLDVKVTASQNLGTFAPSLGRQYDIAWGTPADVVAARAQGLGIEVIAGAYRDSSANQQAQIFSGADSGITDIAGLKGKRIATPTLAGTLYLSLLTSLERAGISPKDVKFVEVPFPNMLDQVKAGRVDAAAVVQPFVGAFRAAGQRALGDPFVGIDDPALAGMWIASSDWIKKNPDEAKAYQLALDQTVTWIGANETEARALIATLLKLPPAVAKSVPLPDWTSAVAPEDLDPWIEAVKQSGAVKGAMPKSADLVPHAVS